MSIFVVEGPDNAGKTQLAQYLAKELNALYIKAERPRRGPDLLTYQSILEQAQQYSGCVIADRHVAISEPIYGTICRGDHQLNHGDIGMCLRRLTAVIYCRPPDEHVIGKIAERGHMAGVAQNVGAIVSAYDAFFSGRPRVQYDFTQQTAEHVARGLMTLSRRYP
mgnify:CR=1 FL=1